jgi:hypothetical protein
MVTLWIAIIPHFTVPPKLFSLIHSATSFEQQHFAKGIFLSSNILKNMDN